MLPGARRSPVASAFLMRWPRLCAGGRHSGEPGGWAYASGRAPEAEWPSAVVTAGPLMVRSQSTQMSGITDGPPATHG